MFLSRGTALQLWVQLSGRSGLCLVSRRCHGASTNHLRRRSSDFPAYILTLQFQAKHYGIFGFLQPRARRYCKGLRSLQAKRKSNRGFVRMFESFQRIPYNSVGGWSVLGMLPAPRSAWQGWRRSAQIRIHPWAFCFSSTLSRSKEV